MTGIENQIGSARPGCATITCAILLRRFKTNVPSSTTSTLVKGTHA
jgi:hypothetical protein